MKRKGLLFGGVVLALLFGMLFVQGDVAATNLSTSVNLNVSPTLTGTVGLSSARAEVTAATTFTLANGTGLNQGDVVYTSSASIASGATLSLDLAGGGLTDAFGAAFGPAKLKLVYIESCGEVKTGCTAANTTNLTLLGNANSVPILNTAATTTTLTPGDVFFVTRRAAAGIAVTAGTGDIVQIVNAAGATAYVKIVLVGTSA